MIQMAMGIEQQPGLQAIAINKTFQFFFLVAIITTWVNNNGIIIIVP
jgi:hypothetical protein